MSTNTKHPHDEMIRAWLDGKPLEFRTSAYGAWERLSGTEWYGSTLPCFSRGNEYRIKPETIRYRVALLKSMSGQFAYAVKPVEYDCTANHFTFVRWLGDEQEVEV